MNESRARKSRLLPIVVMLVATAGLVGCGGEEAATPVTSSPAGAAPVAAPAAAPASPVDVAPQTVAELLDAARSAMREQRLIQPVGDNACLLYTSPSPRD